MAAVLRIIARHPVLAFMVIGLGAGFLTAAIRPIADVDVLPYGLPCTDSWEVCSASASPHLWSLQRSRAGKALLILLGAACAGGSRSAGIWSPCSPFPWEQRSFHWLYMAQVRGPNLTVAGREHSRRWPASLCFSCSACRRDRIHWSC
jgi:hypothetical protein